MIIKVQLYVEVEGTVDDAKDLGYVLSSFISQTKILEDFGKREDWMKRLIALNPNISKVTIRSTEEVLEHLRKTN